MIVVFSNIKPCCQKELLQIASRITDSLGVDLPRNFPFGTGEFARNCSIYKEY